LGLNEKELNKNKVVLNHIYVSIRVNWAKAAEPISVDSVAN